MAERRHSKSIKTWKYIVYIALKSSHALTEKFFKLKFSELLIPVREEEEGKGDELPVLRELEELLVPVRIEEEGEGDVLLKRWSLLVLHLLKQRVHLT